MIEFIIEIPSIIGDNASNPAVRILASLIASMLSLGLSAMGYQKIVEKAKVISAKREQKDEDEALKEERESIWEYVDDEYYTLKSELWAGISDWKHTLKDAGVDTVTIDERSNTLSGKSVNEYKNDFNTAMKDIRDRFKRKYIRKIKRSIRMGKNVVHRREETLLKISSQMRKLFFDELHKICGKTRSDITEMEAKYAGLVFFNEMSDDIMTHIEEVSVIREIEIENLRKEHSVKTFDLKKIYRTLFHK